MMIPATRIEIVFDETIKVEQNICFIYLRYFPGPDSQLKISVTFENDNKFHAFHFKEKKSN